MKTKWDKLKQYYQKENKLYNVTDDIAMDLA